MIAVFLTLMFYLGILIGFISLCGMIGIVITMFSYRNNKGIQIKPLKKDERDFIEKGI